MVKRGQRGDAVLLRPTVMFCVPLILDWIYKEVTEQARRKSALARDLLAFSVQYRLDCINTGQVSSDQSTAVILDPVRPPRCWTCWCSALSVPCWVAGSAPS